MPRPVTLPISAAICWMTTIKGKLNRKVHESPKPNCAPIWLCVPIPLGSSSAAPVTRPGPSRRHRLSSGECCSLSNASFMRSAAQWDHLGEDVTKKGDIGIRSPSDCRPWLVPEARPVDCHGGETRSKPFLKETQADISDGMTDVG